MLQRTYDRRAGMTLVGALFGVLEPLAESLRFSSGGGATIPPNRGAPAGGLHRAGHSYDPNSGPALSRRPGNSCGRVSIDLRPTDETVIGATMKQAVHP